MWQRVSVLVTVVAVTVYILVLLAMPPQALAQSTISLTISPDSWTIPSVTAGAAYSTFDNGVQGYFTLTNDGDVTEDFTIKGTNASGSTVTWTLSKNPSAADEYSLGFGQATGGAAPWTECTDYTEFDTTGNDVLTTGLTVSSTYLFDLELLTYTGTDVTQVMKTTVTITAVAS